jgi:hypothetical protein
MVHGHAAPEPRAGGEGGIMATLLFANLATLLYFAIHFDSLVARFVP